MSETATVAQTVPANLNDVIRLRVKRDELRRVIKNLTDERDAANKRVTDLQKDFDKFKADADANPLKKQLTEAKQKLRTTEHRRTFDEIAKERGANPKALDDLFEKSGWKAEGDEIDEVAMQEAIDAQKEARPFLFGTGQQAEINGEPVKPGPASGGGARKRAPAYPAEAIPITDKRNNDAAWQMLNQDKLVLSARAKLDNGIEEQF